MAVDSQIELCAVAPELDALIAGKLPAGDILRVLGHAVECPRCLDHLRQSGFSTGAARAILRDAASDTIKSEAPAGVSPDHAAARNTPAPSTGHTTTDLAPGDSRRARSRSDDWSSLLAPPERQDELGRLGGYRILRVLGEGGMGVVFEAEDLVLERRVAIKVLHPGAIDLDQQRRFLREAQLAASLSSDHIVTVHQVGEARGCSFLVMELLRGESLEARLKRDRWLPVAEALRIAREVAEGLAAAHDRQLVHRDIKPANVWLEASRTDQSVRRAKLLDFGIARPMNVQQHLTLDGHIVGTPVSMSPEQACGRPVDERSDLFSLGCLLYAMLSGKLPFERAGYVQTLKAVVDEKASPLSGIVPSLPARVERLVERLLAKDPAQRPKTAQQVADEIRLLEHHLPSTLATGNTTQMLQIEPKERKRLGWEAWAGGAAIVLAALLGVWSQYDRVVEMREGASAPRQTAYDAANGGANANVPAADGTVLDDEGDAVAPAVDQPTIKIGIVHSLSGPMATSERPIVDAMLLAIDEINEAGGLLNGRRIEPIIRDGKSSEIVFAQEAEELITEDGVATLFGCWRSPCRKTVEEVCRKHNHLLLYPTAYEGLESSPYVVYLGGAPNQQIIPAAKWAFAFLGKRKFYLIGVDGIYSRSVHEIIRDELRQLGGEVVGEGFRHLGETDFADIARDIVESKADVIINTVSGTGNFNLFYYLREAGITSEKIPTISFKISEEELQNIAAYDAELAGDYAVWSYFQSLPNQENQDFLERLHQHFGPSRVANDPMAAAYAGVYIWGRAVEAAQSDRALDIRQCIADQTFEAPEGALAIDPNNRHACRRALIGQVNEQLQFDLVWSSPKPIPPEPYPASRTPDEWRAFQRDLKERVWHGHWRPDAPRTGTENSGAILPPTPNKTTTTP